MDTPACLSPALVPAEWRAKLLGNEDPVSGRLDSSHGSQVVTY